MTPVSYFLICEHSFCFVYRYKHQTIETNESKSFAKAAEDSGKKTFILYMPKRSAGILAYRYHQQQLEILLVHPGGPFYAKKDEGVWSIPKGEYEDGEDPLQVAKNEFKEETGNVILHNHLVELMPVKLKSGKTIRCWASEENFEQGFISSNNFEMEWPPKSGKMQSFPEVDKAEWFSISVASIKIHPSQLPLLKELEMILHVKGNS